MKRRSVYHAGSQQQQNHSFDDEAMQTFLPNIESTRLMQSTMIDKTMPLNPSEILSNGQGSK